MQFAELLSAKNFREAVHSLARDFRTKHALGKIHQLGLVVPEVEQAAKALEAKGIGPFFIASGSPVLWNERGVDKKFRGKMGLAYHQGLELELLEPGQGSDFYRNHLDPKGGIVIQHLGFLCKDVDESAKKLESAGFPTWVRGRLKSFPLTTEFAYMDTISETGFIIEFISWRLLGIPFSPPPSLIHTLGRLEKWSGKRSISL